jgi:hypothetical protein
MFRQIGNITVFKEMVKHSPFANRDSLDAFNRMLWQPAQGMVSKGAASQGIGGKFPPLFPGMPIPGAGAPPGVQAFFPMLKNPMEFAQGFASAVVGLQLNVMGWALEVTIGSLAAIDESIEKANQRLKENDPAGEFARSLVKTTYLAATDPEVPAAEHADPEKSW